ncbi:NnrS family protein [Dechloromonas sp. HYN0024]|uniref:NnrS family protein n=1 Tax=Dechloromonas sp. HYN0024 TaxID=2231055 RepID=UPI000E442FDD|nr:NnrS family protein [Dechloromonas sp. HYN0024]AXS80266.1 NnrS family protein [Dechloromonas sp. HYN0024]
MHFSTHPFWLVGFRPFFSLTCLAGMSLPVIWALIFSGAVTLPDASFTAVQWHAHEMFFGFGWAVLGGFLLTSTKNWVNIRGYHGPALILLAAAWIIERIGMAFGGSWPHAAFLLTNNLFLGSIVAMLLWTLIRHRETDSYRDNAFFLIMLPGFLIAKYLMLEGGDFTTGYSMAIGLFRLAFLVMLERTLTGFMKAAFQTQLLRHPVLDMSIKLLGLVLVLEFALPRPITAAISLTLATLLAIRFFYWKPQLAFQRLDIGVMYIGYLCLVAQLLIEALGHAVTFIWVGSVSVHLFTFGVMGLIIPGMIVRISKGHTGRKVIFQTGDKLVLVIMLAALFARIIAPQWLPAAYLGWIHLAATCWFAAFAILGWRTIPLLLRPRIDGREH